MVVDITLNDQSFAENGQEKLKALGVLLGVRPGMPDAATPETIASVGSTVEKTGTAPAAAAPAPVQSQPQQSAVPVPDVQVPTAAPTYTLSQLQAAIGPLLSLGKGPELQALLAKYNVAQMTDLKGEQIDLFATDLRAMGAQI